MPRLQSDVAPAVYVNWLAPAAALQACLPKGLVVQRVGKTNLAVFTVVMFRHGHFGPRLLGPLRRLAPSPIQSNWRTYVENPATGRRGVHFLTTTVSNPLYRLAARLTADNVPMRPAVSRIDVRNGDVEVMLSGRGRTPNLRGRWQESPPIGQPWSAAFPDWQAMLEFVVPQDRALAVRDGTVVRIELALDIPLASVRPLRGTVAASEVERLVGNARPWAFWVPKVGLRYERQRRDA